MDKFVIFYREWHSFLWGRGRTMMTMSIEGDADCPDQKPISMARQRTVRNVLREKNGIMWEKFPNLGGSDPNPLHIFLCFFPIQGLKNGKKLKKER